MRLTSSQLETLRSIESGLGAGNILALTGGANGKSTILQHLLARHFPSRTDTLKRSQSNLVCCEIFPVARYKVTPVSLMRQILVQLGVHSSQESVRVQRCYHSTLKTLSDHGKILAVLIDGAEHLTPSCYESLKYLNGLRSSFDLHTRGVGILLAGGTGLLKRFPSEFADRCRVIRLSRVSSNELDQYVKLLRPRSADSINGEMLQLLERCSSNLQIKNTLDQAVRKQSELRLPEVDSRLIESFLPSIPKLPNP